jgi:hypothetical protein
MTRTSKMSFSTRQRLSALVCLVALMLMYGRIATSTVMAVTGACCSGDQCPIHGNRHHSQKSEETPMDCGHNGHVMSKTDSCTMSCCHNVEQSTVLGNLFLLDPGSLSTSLAPLSAASLAHAATDLSRAFAPLAPPPKSFLI